MRGWVGANLAEKGKFSWRDRGASCWSNVLFIWIFWEIFECWLHDWISLPCIWIVAKIYTSCVNFSTKISKSCLFKTGSCVGRKGVQGGDQKTTTTRESWRRKKRNLDTHYQFSITWMNASRFTIWLCSACRTPWAYGALPTLAGGGHYYDHLRALHSLVAREAWLLKLVNLRMYASPQTL